MKRLLLLVPKCKGPSPTKKWNESWPDNIESLVSKNMWKLITPGVLVLARLAEAFPWLRVELVDESLQELDPTQSFDIVAMYTVTPNAGRAYELADDYRKRGTYVVLGGVHATVCPEEAAGHADTMLLGEVENIWPEFLKDFELGRPRKVYSQALGEVDLDRSPAPAFHHIPENGRRLIPIQTARGCPHGCKFCNLRSLYGKPYRAKSLANIEKELQAVQDINPQAVIYFTDDNLFCHRPRVEALMPKIKEHHFLWYANSDISFGRDRKLIEMAYQCGCRQVLIGLESVNPANLKGIDEDSFKSRNYLDYKELIANIQSNGIGVIGSFILGLDEDDPDIFDQTIDFIRETKLFGANITVNTPYPGAGYFQALAEENRIITYNWDCYTIFNPVVVPKQMSIEELNEGYLRVLQTIHSRDHILSRINYFAAKIKELGKN